MNADSRGNLHTDDAEGSTHTFRFHRRRPWVLGIICLVIGGGCLVALYAGLFFASAGGTAGQDAWLAGGAAFFLWAGIRAFRVGVSVSPGKLTIRNELFSRSVKASDIRAITLEPRAIGDGLPRWIARVHLADDPNSAETSTDMLAALRARRKGMIWIDDFDCGPASKPPKPERVAAVDEVRALLHVATVEAD